MNDDLVKRLRDVAGVIIGAQSQNLEYTDASSGRKIVPIVYAILEVDNDE